jgi:hypothetical protein
MPRTYNPQSVVELPRLDQKAGLAVGTATVHAAKGEKKLAPNVAAALQGVTYALTGLQAAHDAPPPPPESGAGEQRRAESAAWAGVENWLAGLKALHGTPLAATAQHLHEVLFPNGLLFVREQTE